MGRFTPAWASALLAACVLLGLAFVNVAPAEQQTRPRRPAPQRPVAAGKPVQVRLASSRVHRTTTARVAVSTSGTSSAACPAGLIALTFDDGPNPAVTRKLVSTLVRLKVPATFFMIGGHVKAHPELARLVQSKGFIIGNHTWSHPVLTDLTNKQIRHQLDETSAEFTAAHVRVSRLMRPPYGAIDARVRKVVRSRGMIPVLWTIDSRDWAGGGPSTIAARILGALRRHGTNLVLQHDGVDNSPASLAAVPLVVREARKRGYCFTHLRSNGGVGGASAPSSAKRIVPARSAATSSHPARPSAARPTSAVARADREERVLLLFASGRALRMPRSAYLHALAGTLTHRQG